MEPNMNLRQLGLVVALAATLAIGTTALGASASSASEATGASDVAPAPSSLQNASNESNQTTARHLNPGELEGDRDLGRVQSWLAREMSSRLEQSSQRLREGQYEDAKELLGNDYEERYSQYRDIARRVRGGGAGEEIDSVGRLRTQQREFLAAVQAYETTYEEFEAARDNGSEEQARRLARQLQRIEERIDTGTGPLVDNYRTASNNTEMNLSENVRIVRNISENVSERQRGIETELFVQTELTASAENDTASFADPLVIRGRLVTANGSAIGGENMTFRVGNRTLYARTNDTGGFTLEYAPANLSTNTTEVTLEYVPDNESVYDRSNETIGIEVVQTNATFDVTAAPDTAAFDEEVVVRGTVQVEGRAVPDVPVALFVGDERLGNDTTAENGTFVVEGALPADVSTDSTLRVTLPAEDRALAATDRSLNVSIQPTETELTLNATHADNETVRVVGRFRTDDGTPLDNRSIQVSMNGRTLAVVQTERTGVYGTTVTIPEALRDRDAITVAATFDGTGTNLNPTRTNSSIGISSSGERGRALANVVDTVASAPWWTFLIVGSVLVPVAYGLANRFDSRTGEIDALAESAGGERSTDAPDTGVPDPTAELLPFAREQLARGDPEAATHAVYVAVRRDLGERFGLDEPLTHWEFFAGCRDAELTGDRLEALQQVVQAEERAQFASGAVPADVAEEALEGATRLVGGASTDETRP